jgi:hypothetical protein
VATPAAEVTPPAGVALRGDGSLCRRDEQVVMDCRFEHKQLALCGSADYPKEGSVLRYRFGSPARVEMEYPAPGERGRYFHSSRMFSGGGEQLAWFSVGEWDYLLFSRMVRTGFGADGHNDTAIADGLLLVRAGRFVSVDDCTNDAPLPPLPDTVAAEGEFPLDVSEHLPP